jgi:hypothetical protein
MLNFAFLYCESVRLGLLFSLQVSDHFGFIHGLPFKLFSFDVLYV